MKFLAQLPNSFREYQSQIREALRTSPPPELAGADSYYLEGCIGDFPNKIIFEAHWWNKEPPVHKYFQADVSLGEGDAVKFENVIEVEIQAAVTAKDEMRKLEESDTSEHKKFVTLNETMDTKVHLVTIEEAAVGQKKRTGKAELVQQGDIVNQNGRYYPGPVLKEATEYAKKRIEADGYLLMDSQHRINAKGDPENNIRETVALNKSIAYDEETAIVSLPEIEFVETQAGKDVIKLLEAGATFGISQRGVGSSHTFINPQTGETYEKVDFVRFNGFDLVPSGQTGVKGARLESVTEGTQGQLSGAAEGGDGTPTEGAQGGASATGTGAGGGNLTLTEERPAELALSAKDRELIQNNLKAGMETQQAVSLIEGKLAESQRVVDAVVRKQEVTHLKEISQTLLEQEIEKYSRFNAEQKQLIISRISPVTLYDRISDVYNEETVLQVLKPEIAKEVERTDETIATLKLEQIGFGAEQSTGLANAHRGRTRIQIVNESFPDAELHHKVYEHVLQTVKKTLPKNAYMMQENDEKMRDLDKIMESFANHYGSRLLQESQLSQADIGGRIATISAMVIPIAWRLITAFQVVDTEPMTTRILDKKIRKYSEDTTSTDVVTQYANLDPGEGGTIQSTKVTYGTYPIYSTRQALRHEITPEAIATAYNTPMQPLMDTVEALALDLRQRLDLMLWWQHIIHAARQSTQQVTTFETLTRVGTTNTWYAANKGWIPYAWHKTHDTEGNPTSAKFYSMLPAIGQSAAPTGYGFQGVELQDSGNTALLYGTDYTVDFVAGTITLTAAGETKRGSDNVQAKYSYSSNINMWSRTPPSGTTLTEHIHSLRRSVGKARVAVGDRNYQPNFVAYNIDTEDIITQGNRMTYLGGSPSDLMDQMNQVMKYGGLDPVATTAIPKGYVIVGEKGSVCHAVQIPWMFSDLLTDEVTGKQYTLGQQFSASDCPVNARLSLVGLID